MENLLPLLQADEGSTEQRLLEQQWQIRSSETAFRTLLSRATTVLIFLACSLIIYYMLPFYPPAMSIFLAIIFALISYRWPAVALSLMLLFAAPAYSYQLGGAFWALGVFIAIAVVLPFCVSRLPGAILGCAVGTAAGVLMLTPYFLLSVPLLAGIILFRLPGSSASGGWGLFMFLTIYLPFLFMVQPPVAQGETIPLFTTVDYPKQLSLSNLDLTSLKTAFQGHTNDGFSGFPAASTYFVQGWSGIVLILTMLMAIVVAPLALKLSTRIEETRILLRALSPFIMLSAISLIFLLPLQLLEKPLGYHTGFDSWNNIGIFIGIMLAFGSIGLIMEVWFCRRNIKVRLRGDLAYLSIELYSLLDNAKKRLREVSAVCHNKAFGDETAAIKQCEEKVSLTLESEAAMGLPRLEISCSEFQNMQSQLSDLHLRLETKLLDHLEESRRTYKATFDKALALGIPSLQDVTQTLPLTSKKPDYESALMEQQTLNRALRDLAGKLVSAGDMLAKTIKEEVDPEFSLTTIDIGHGFIEQGRFDEAARTISEDLQIIDGRIERSIVELSSRVIKIANEFQKVVASHLIPVFETIGDSDAINRYNEKVDALKTAATSVQGSRTLADMIKIVEQSRKLTDLATTTVNELSNRIDVMAEANDRRCPARYNWGKNTHTAGEAHQLLESIESTPSETTISRRFELIEKSVKTIEQQARVVKQYSQASEFLVNYPNIEYTLQDKLRTNGGISSSELPVKARYALEYLKLHAALNYNDVTFDPKTGSIQHTPDKNKGQDETAK